MSNQTTITTAQDAIVIANEIERHEAALKQMKDALKAYVEQSGPVDTGYKVWDFSTSVSWSFTADNLKALATEIMLMGHNPWEHLSIGSETIKKLKLTESILKQYGTPKSSKRFSGKKSDTVGRKIA